MRSIADSLNRNVTAKRLALIGHSKATRKLRVIISGGSIMIAKMKCLSTGTVYLWPPSGTQFGHGFMTTVSGDSDNWIHLRQTSSFLLAGLISEAVGRGPAALLRIHRTVAHSTAMTARPSPTRPVWFSLPFKGHTAASQQPTVAE